MHATLARAQPGSGADRAGNHINLGGPASCIYMAAAACDRRYLSPSYTHMMLSLLHPRAYSGGALQRALPLRRRRAAAGRVGRWARCAEA
jgi:hypothetical protein